MTDPLAALGANLTRLLAASGLSDREVGARAWPDLTRESAGRTIQRYKTGAIWPKPEALVGLADALKCDVSELFQAPHRPNWEGLVAALVANGMEAAELADVLDCDPRVIEAAVLQAEGDDALGS